MPGLALFLRLFTPLNRLRTPPKKNKLCSPCPAPSPWPPAARPPARPAASPASSAWRRRTRSRCVCLEAAGERGERERENRERELEGGRPRRACLSIAPLPTRAWARAAGPTRAQPFSRVPPGRGLGLSALKWVCGDRLGPPSQARAGGAFVFFAASPSGGGCAAAPMRSGGGGHPSKTREGGWRARLASPRIAHQARPWTRLHPAAG